MFIGIKCLLGIEFMLGTKVLLGIQFKLGMNTVLIVYTVHRDLFTVTFYRLLLYTIHNFLQQP